MRYRSMIGSILAMAIVALLCMSTTAWAGGGSYGSPGFEVLAISVDVVPLGDTYAMHKGNTIIDPTDAAPMVYSRIPEVTKPEIDVVTNLGHPLKCPCGNHGALSYGDDNGYDLYGNDAGVLTMHGLSMKEAALSGFGNPGPQTGYLS